MHIFKTGPMAIVTALLFGQVALANADHHFGSTDASSYTCDVQSSTGIADRLGLSASNDEFMGPNKKAMITPRLRFKTLHRRKMPTEPLDLTPFDEIVLKSLVPNDRQFADGYYLNETIGSMTEVPAFTQTAPTPLDFGTAEIKLVVSRIRFVSIQFAPGASPGDVLISVQDGGELLDGRGVASRFNLSFSGTCRRGADNVNFGF